MTAVRISGTFKKDERPKNGLEAIAKELLDRDRSLDRHVVVAVVRPHASRWTAEDGEEIPTAALDQIEVMEGKDAQTARRLLEKAYKARVGSLPQQELPIDGDGEGEGDD